MRSADEFQQFYHRELLPHLEAVEEKRKQTLGKLKWTGLSVLGITLVALMVEPIAAVVVLVAGAIVTFMLYNRWSGRFVARFKDDIIKRIIAFVDPNLTYRRKGFIPRELYMSSGLFTTKPDRYQGEDYVSGMVEKTAMQFSELHTEYESTTTDADGNTTTSWSDIFKGIYFVADFNKHFQGQTQVVPDTAERLLGRVGRKLQSMTNTRPGKLIQLEDVEFEKRFAVFATDEVEARYLLTPALMARITDFVNRTGHEVYISFVNSNIHVAIPHRKDLFEPKLTKTLLNVELAQEYLDDLMLVIGIVEDLNLNTRIWTKQ